MVRRVLKKAWYKSKTLIFNIVAGIPILIEIALPFISSPDFQNIIPEQYMDYYTFGVLFCNFILRLVTTSAVGMSEEQEV